ncbi:MAG: hypothetical protein J6Q53_05020 [Oscillospiraceae bacterium]|nr:hypothetical protein [Oscillospiraceae bacterium]
MSQFRERYGIPANEVQNLYNRYKKNHLEEGFGDFDSFVKFASECGYKPFLHLRRYDASQPYSPDNTFFYDRKAHLGFESGSKKLKTSEIVSPYCVGCKQKCPASGDGCYGWQRYFAQNWNENVRGLIKEIAPPEPPKREFFRYEHPDLIRERRKEQADGE